MRWRLLKRWVSNPGHDPETSVQLPDTEYCMANHKEGVSLKGLGTAFRTLTVISWPWGESKNLSTSLPWFPIVGLILGLILYTIVRMLPFGKWTAGSAFLVLLLDVWLTRGLHLDGLADWADSIGGNLESKRRLEIMRDVHLGAFGVLALVLALMAKWLSFEKMISSGAFIYIAVICALSRSMMVELITTLPYARSGEGMAKAFIKGASLKYRLISHAICFGICIPFGPPGIVFFGLAALITALFRRRCRSRFGGITGDLLGTANVMVEICLIFVCALFSNTILDYTGWMWII